VQQRRQGEVAHPRNRERARNDCESDQERTGGENLLHEGGAKEDPRGIRHHPSERDAAVSRGDSGPVSAKASRGESGEARGGGGDAEEATQAGIREGKRDEAPRRHEDKGDSDGRDAGKEGATPSESSTERGARDSENPNEQTDRAKRGREKEGGATEGIESARGKLEDGFIRKSNQQKPKCHKCGKEGHKIKECRAEKSECGNCKQIGHRAYDRKCPTMKRALEWKIARTARC
jgi:hypothetical protein